MDNEKIDLSRIDWYAILPKMGVDSTLIENPKRTGPYRRFHDLMIDAYGNRGEQYVATMENRSGRMPRITVDDVLSRVEIWRERYTSVIRHSGESGNL